MERNPWIGRSVAAAVVAAASLIAAAAPAIANDSCREWRQEHWDWKTETLRRYLNGAPEREIEEAVFELLQRETWLTSCETSVESGRAILVGWRMRDLPPEEFGGEVVGSVLERAGFPNDLRPLFARSDAVAATPRQTRRVDGAR